MMTHSVYELAVGDTRPAISAYLVDDNGDPATLPSQIRFVMKRADDSSPKIDAAATCQEVVVGDKTRLLAVYQLQWGDTDTAGEYFCEWRLTYPDGTYLTVPSGDYDVVRIKERVAGL